MTFLPSFQVTSMLLAWGPHSDGTGLICYQLFMSTYGPAYQAIETRSTFPRGGLDRVRLVEGHGPQREEETCAKRRTAARRVGWGHGGHICLLPRLGQAPEVRVWDRREAGRRGGEGWGHAERRLGFGREPSAPDPWGWEQWLGRCCLAGCPGTSLFSFPAPISRSSPCSLPLRQAHPVRWPPDSTFLRADFFSAAASAHSHSEAGSEAGDWGDAEGGSGSPPWGPGSALRPKGTGGGVEKEHPLKLEVSQSLTILQT